MRQLYWFTDYLRHLFISVSIFTDLPDIYCRKELINGNQISDYRPLRLRSFSLDLLTSDLSKDFLLAQGCCVSDGGGGRAGGGGAKSEERKKVTSIACKVVNLLFALIAC